jgi:Tfp pilus assembly protein PilO|tara:strand:- start:23338 stop:23892 length:555 start_codon:yes stop_codon:yes gene_type:complete
MSDESKQISHASRPIHLAGTAACAGVVAAAAVLFLLPGVKARKALQAQEVRLGSVNAQLDSAAKTNRALATQVQRLEESVETRRVPLSTFADLNRRLAELTSVCLDRGLAPESIQPQPARAGGVTTVVPIRFEVSGTPDDVYEIIGLFDREHPDMHLGSITIEYVGPETLRLRTVLDWHTTAGG